MTRQQRRVVNEVRELVEELHGDGYSLTDLKILKTLQRVLSMDKFPSETPQLVTARELVREQELAR